MSEQPTSKEIDELLLDLYSPDFGTRKQTISKLGSLPTSNVNIVSELLKTRDSSPYIVIVELVRQALDAPVHQAVLQQNSNLEKAILSQIIQQEEAEKAVKQEQAKAALLAKQIWIRAEEHITWPAICVRCGNPGETTTDITEYDVPLKLLNWSIIPFFRINTWEVQRIKPQYCKDCARGIKEYTQVSESASFIGLLGSGLVFSGIVVVMMVCNLGRYFGVVTFVISLVFSILAGIGIAGLFVKLKGNPPKAFADVNIRHVDDNETTQICIEFSNAAYRELFKKANKHLLTTPPTKN